MNIKSLHNLVSIDCADILRRTHIWWGVGFLAAITSCACVVDATLTPDSSSRMLLRSLLQVAHQGFADDVLQAQVIGGVTKGMIPGVDAAYRPRNTPVIISPRHQMQHQKTSYATFSCFLLELVTAGRLKISVPGCAFPARQHFTNEINIFLWVKTTLRLVF